MFGLGWPEVIVIGVAAMAIFGAKKIPDIGRSVGQALRGFREELDNKTEVNATNSLDADDALKDK